jgi:hypothetical protein
MMIRLLLALLALEPLAYAGDPVPSELLGSWVVSATFGIRLPAECRNIRIEFTAAGNFISINGEQKLIVQASIERQNAAFVLHVQKLIEHNGQPNCQGRPAEYVASHLVDDVYMEREGPVLRMYMWTKDSRQFVEFIRPAPGSA